MDQNIEKILKPFFDNQKVENTLYRNSPFLGKIEKKRVGGLYFPLPSMVSGSGAVCGNYKKMKDSVGRWGHVVQMKVTYGQIFAGFVVSQKEIDSSEGDKAAFVEATTIKNFAALEAMRKLFALSAFGDGTGTIGTNKSQLSNPIGKVKVDNYSLMAIGLGSQLSIFDKSTGAKVQDVIVASIEPGDTASTITFTGNYTGKTLEVDAARIAVADCVDADGKPLLPIGLEGWLPSKDDRNGSDWEEFIKVPFFEVDRSKYVTRLAGNFVKQGEGEKIKQTIARLLEVIRTQGGVPDMVIVNPRDYSRLIDEVDAQLQSIQRLTGADKGTKTEITEGIAKFKFAFSSSWLENVMDDPFCPEHKVYMLDSSTVKFISLNNADKVASPTTSTETPGAPEVASGAGVPKQYLFDFEKFYNMEPCDTDEGPGLLVGLRLFGNFIVANPAHCGVASLNYAAPLAAAASTTGKKTA